MIKALIITPYRRYEFEVPAEHAGTLNLAYDWLENRLHSNHEGLIELPGRMIAIQDPSEVKSIELWEEEVQMPVNLAGVQQLPIEEGPGTLNGDVQYLGNPVQLRMLTHYLRGYFYVLPYEVNEAPALEVLDPNALAQVSVELLQREGIQGTVVIPPAQIGDEQQAHMYVIDYAEQATPPAHFSPSDKTARAAGGIWNEK
ncbi:hypothetical protein [Paenibacillus sp. BK720]|uniref:hypothetical protein n=1 Tax=Paenibacillus sp. BK720 TaxID=2587092 RepID=UPI001422D3A3|nr:hypothetical protein [Paenibacillus sp. BK720]NIK67914.1 hypothetical protein [Paenibacillus sp. BK720]